MTSYLHLLRADVSPADDPERPLTPVRLPRPLSSHTTTTTTTNQPTTAGVGADTPAPTPPAGRGEGGVFLHNGTLYGALPKSLGALTALGLMVGCQEDMEVRLGATLSAFAAVWCRRCSVLLCKSVFRHQYSALSQSPGAPTDLGLMVGCQEGNLRCV